MKTVKFLLIVLFGSMRSPRAQDDCVLHRHGRNEIAISPGGVYSLDEKEWGFGFHAHYFRTLSKNSPWSLGAGFEMVAMHGGHYTVSAGAKYNFLHLLNIGVMPGVTFFKGGYNHDHGHVHNNKAEFTVHVEFSYDLIHTEYLHLGPAIDYSWNRKDQHLMIGLHCGYDF